MLQVADQVTSPPSPGDEAGRKVMYPRDPRIATKAMGVPWPRRPLLGQEPQPWPPASWLDVQSCSQVHNWRETSDSGQQRLDALFF